MSNTSVYLNKWEKEMIKSLIENHLEANKTNMFYDYVKTDFINIINKLEYDTNEIHN